MDLQQKNRTKWQIESAILSFAPSVTLKYPMAFDEVQDTIRRFMRNHPEIFWFSHQYFYDENTGILKLQYNFTLQKVDSLKEEIDKVIKDDFQIDYVKTLSELERVVYVYKWTELSTLVL